MRSIPSLFRALRRASPRELVFRLGQSAGDSLETGLASLGWIDDPAAAEPIPTKIPIAFADPWLGHSQRDAAIARLRRERPDYVAAIVQEADRYCRNEFEFFGQTFRYGDEIPWCADPVTGRPWPMAFHTRIDIFSGSEAVGDVKYVWELGRHQFLPTLGKAYRLTGREEYAEKGLALIEDWIQSNPYKLGIHWTSALEVAVRSLSWCWACALWEGSPALSADRRQRIARSLLQHASYIEQHLSIYFSPYNHLIGEATALFAVGSLLPWARRAWRMRERGWSILSSEIGRQFHADGGTVEQALGYHHFTLGFYMQAVLARLRIGDPVPAQMSDRLESAFTFSHRLRRPDGRSPMIGDGDEGRALSLWQAETWDFRSYLAVGAVLYRRADFKRAGERFPSDAAWLVGPDGWDTYDMLASAPPAETSSAFLESGYAVLRTDWSRDSNYLLFDFGPLADGIPEDGSPTAAHGHADALSIEVCSFGTPLLIDPGFYTYNGPLDWHRYFRETEAHNTVVVDATSQAVFRGRLKWSDAPRVTLRKWNPGADATYVEAEHTGFTRIPGAPVHRRGVLQAYPGYWLLRDEISGAGQHVLDRYFHAAPGVVVVRPSPDRVLFRSPTGPGLLAVLIDGSSSEVEILNGRDGPSGGWAATRYDQRVPASVVRVRSRGPLPALLRTLLVPFRDEPPRVLVQIQRDSERLGNDITEEVTLCVGNRRDRYNYGPLDGGRIVSE